MSATVQNPSVARSRPIQANVVGTVSTAAAAYVTAVEEYGVGPIRQTKLTVSALPVTITDNGANGSGGIKIYDFPKGVTAALGGSCKLAVAYGSVTDANVIGSVGSATAGADATLTTTEADFIKSTTCPTTSGVGALAGNSVASPTNIGTGSTASAAYFNLATSTDPTTNNSATVTGWIILTWLNHGDNTIA